MTFKPFKPSNVFNLHAKYNNLREIEVLDVLMGSGKTHSALRHIEGLALANRQERWIYCTERLDEIAQRTSENSEAQSLWRTPSDQDGTKLDALKELLREPGVQLIAITHALLLDAAKDKMFQHLINAKGFKLLLDETVDLITPYGGIKYEEFLWHMAEGRLSVDTANYGKVQWLDESVRQYSKGELAVDRLRDEEDLVHAAVNGRQVRLVRIEDEAIFRVFHRVILTTYQFDQTFLAAYLALKGIPWSLCTDIRCAWTTSKAEVRDLITVITKHNEKFDRIKLSSTWYGEKAGKKEFDLISKTFRTIGDSHGCKGNPWLLGYTLPEDSLGTTRKLGVQPRGYPHTKCMLGADGKEIDGTRDKARSSHIPCNARASNDWSGKKVMVHAFNRYPLPDVSGFLDGYGIEYSPERFALNELLQWLWRSAIRNGEPIHVAILSKRMRELFMEWREAPEATNVVPFPSRNRNAVPEKLAA